jgi:hypothetical protein
LHGLDATAAGLMLGRMTTSRPAVDATPADDVPLWLQRWRRLWRREDPELVTRGVARQELQRETRSQRGRDEPATGAAAWRVAADVPAPDASAVALQVGDAIEGLRTAFTPRQTKRWRDHFVGRARQIERAVMAITDEQAHVVLFGDRGRGKTSLANVLTERLGDQGYLIVRCACSAEITFEALFRQLLQRIPTDRLDCRLDPGASLATLLPQPGFGASELADVARHVTRGRVLMIVDEFDRIEDPAMRMRLADTIKSLSDARSRIHLLIVGVASSLEGLLGAHPSIQRNVVGIHVPLMDAAEIEAVVASGAATAGLVFERTVIDAIVAFSQGLPYCAQLFSLYAGRHALRRGSRSVAWADFCLAGEAVLEEMRSGVGLAYERAITGSSGEWAAELLSRIASAESDLYGVFCAAAIAAAIGEPADPRWRLVLDRLQCEEAGPILLQASDTGLVFANSIMRHFILLRDFAASGGLRGDASALPQGGHDALHRRAPKLQGDVQ